MASNSAIAQAGAPGVNNDTTYTKLFVGGLAWGARIDDLREHFKEFGELAEAVVIFEKETGKSKGYGFVTYFRPEDAQKALADPYPVIAGRRANCNLAAFGRKTTHANQFDLYGGGGGYEGYGADFYGAGSAYSGYQMPVDPYWGAAAAPNPNFPPVWPYGPAGGAASSAEGAEQASEVEPAKESPKAAPAPVAAAEKPAETPAPEAKSEAPGTDASTAVPAGAGPMWMGGYPGFGAPMMRPPWAAPTGRQGPPGWSRESAMAAAAAGIHPIQWYPPDPEAQQSLRKQFGLKEDDPSAAKSDSAPSGDSKKENAAAADPSTWPGGSPGYWGRFPPVAPVFPHGINLGAVGIPLSAQFGHHGRGRGRGGYGGGGGNRNYYNNDRGGGGGGYGSGHNGGGHNYSGRTQRVTMATASVSTSDETTSDAATNTPGPQKDSSTSTTNTPAGVRVSTATSTDADLAVALDSKLGV